MSITINTVYASSDGEWGEIIRIISLLMKCLYAITLYYYNYCIQMYTIVNSNSTEHLLVLGGKERLIET